MTGAGPSLAEAKDLAKRLRAQFASKGTAISHARALELVARQHGFRDWNTMHALLRDQTARGWTVGETVRGKYLSRPFTAEVLTVSSPSPGWAKLELRLHAPIDVVASARFSNKRRFLRGTVGPKGYSAERTSDGAPQLQINLTEPLR
ncbi:MAG: glyoxalase superfamily protein [Pseudomonadota bacterium]